MHIYRATNSIPLFGTDQELLIWKRIYLQALPHPYRKDFSDRMQSDSNHAHISMKGMPNCAASPTRAGLYANLRKTLEKDNNAAKLKGTVGQDIKPPPREEGPPRRRRKWRGGKNKEGRGQRTALKRSDRTAMSAKSVMTAMPGGTNSAGRKS